MLGDNIMHYRKLKGLNKKDLAALVGVTPAYISLIENNERKNPSTKTVKSIANALDVPVDELYKDTSDDKLTLEDIKEIAKKNKIETIAAHFEGEEFTQNDLEDIEEFIKFVISRKKKE